MPLRLGSAHPERHVHAIGRHRIGLSLCQDSGARLLRPAHQQGTHALAARVGADGDEVNQALVLLQQGHGKGAGHGRWVPAALEQQLRSTAGMCNSQAGTCASSPDHPAVPAPAHQQRLVQHTVIEHGEDGGAAPHTPAVLGPGDGVCRNRRGQAGRG